MSSAVVPKEDVSAWQRWELAGFDQRKAPSAPRAAADGPAPHLPTVGEVERIHQDAHKQGYAAGYEEGTARARMEAMRLHSLVESLDAALGGLDQQIAEDLLALALEVARQVVRQTIRVRPETIVEIVREALQQAPHQHAAIYLHPEDASLVRSYLGDQLAHAGHRIFEEAAIDRGGTRIEAGSSHLDAGMDTRWRRVIESMGTTNDWVEAPAGGSA